MESLRRRIMCTLLRNVRIDVKVRNTTFEQADTQVVEVGSDSGLCGDEPEGEVTLVEETQLDADETDPKSQILTDQLSFKIKDHRSSPVKTNGHIREDDAISVHSCDSDATDENLITGGQADRMSQLNFQESQCSHGCSDSQDGAASILMIQPLHHDSIAGCQKLIDMNDINLGSQRVTRSRLSEMMSDPQPLFSDSQGEDYPLTVSCPCQNKNASWHMVQCIRCQSWSHSACEGYFSEKDEHILKKEKSHVCVSCAFHPNAEQLDRISDVFLLRRCLSVFVHQKPVTVRQLAQHLDVVMPLATQLKNRVQALGLLKTQNQWKHGGSIIWNAKTRDVMTYWKSKAPIESIMKQVDSQRAIQYVLYVFNLRIVVLNEPRSALWTETYL